MKTMIKRQYEKPSMEVYSITCHVPLLQVSQLDGTNPFQWDDPGDNDR